MNIAGPVLLATTGQIVHATDPARFQPASESVQIQNFSGFLVTAVIGGMMYLLPSLSASTVPTRKDSTLTLTATQVTNAFGQSINLVWLQRDESPAMADGPLTLGSSQSLGLKAIYTFNLPGTPPEALVLSAPPAGYAWSLYAANVYTANAGTLYVASTAANGPPQTAQAVAIGNPTRVSLGGMIMPGAVYAQFTSAGAFMDFFYDLFPAPIS